MAPTFSQHISRFQQNSDQAPRWVHDKLKLRHFAGKRGLPVPALFRSWGTPDEIDWAVAPEEFVIKANVLHGGKGTFALRRLPNDDFENLLDNSVHSQEEIIAQHQALYNKSEYQFSHAIMIEELIRGADGTVPSPEYEVFAFRNRTSLVVKYTREQGMPTKVNFFDGQFLPLRVSDVAANSSSLTSGELSSPEDPTRVLKVASALASAVDSPYLSVSILDGQQGPTIIGASPFPRSRSYGAKFDLTPDWNRRLGSNWLN